ncbi:unnamed protein product [Caenorhabditis auriculariae]|uniref:Uncharacterized protein n=1 Tax=Caenorhabditis auriculariae TaxID=2777116 RepID=A0A8S1HPI7_9PELO|nr:unnamed protein product [Caenorhabditis auriculariae]
MPRILARDFIEIEQRILHHPDVSRPGRRLSSIHHGKEVEVDKLPTPVENMLSMRRASAPMEIIIGPDGRPVFNAPMSPHSPKSVSNDIKDRDIYQKSESREASKERARRRSSSLLAKKKASPKSEEKDSSQKTSPKRGDKEKLKEKKKEKENEKIKDDKAKDEKRKKKLKGREQSLELDSDEMTKVIDMATCAISLPRRKSIDLSDQKNDEETSSESEYRLERPEVVFVRNVAVQTSDDVVEMNPRRDKENFASF